MKKIILIFSILFSSVFSFAQVIKLPLENNLAIGIHPRGIIKVEEVPIMRAKVKTAPYQLYLNQLIEKCIKAEYDFTNQRENNNIQDLSFYAKDLSLIAVLTGDKSWATKAYDVVYQITKDEEFFQNPISRGLDRATLATNIALVYDLCYNNWTEIQRININNEIIKIAYTISANMGSEANNNIESNWQGIRYATVVTCTTLWDEVPGVEEKKSLASPLAWPARSHLSTHINENLFENGWNVESMSYHCYNWSFISVAMLCLKNKYPDKDVFSINKFAPKAINSIWALSTGAISVFGKNNVGIKPDFSDDHTQVDTRMTGLLCLARKIYPKEYSPVFAWMQKYLTDSVHLNHGDINDNFHRLLSMLDDDGNLINPKSIGWNQYYDNEAGVWMFRNKFKDQNDIVTAFSATQKRKAGHSGADVNSVRLIGLGSTWLLGAGRTSLIEGQSGMFPENESIPKTKTKILGKIVYKNIGDNQKMNSIVSQGNCLGVDGFYRGLWVSYDKSKTGAEAFIVIRDTSINGKIWRFCTPEYQQIETTEDGFLITSPDGASLKVTVFSNKVHTNLIQGKVRYGGETVVRNSGINWNGNYYEYAKKIDIQCDKNIVLVFTLQPKGKTHPKITYSDVTKDVTSWKTIVDLDFKKYSSDK